MSHTWSALSKSHRGKTSFSAFLSTFRSASLSLKAALQIYIEPTCIPQLLNIDPMNKVGKAIWGLETISIGICFIYLRFPYNLLIKIYSWLEWIFAKLIIEKKKLLKYFSQLFFTEIWKISFWSLLKKISLLPQFLKIFLEFLFFVFGTKVMILQKIARFFLRKKIKPFFVILNIIGRGQGYPILFI